MRPEKRRFVSNSPYIPDLLLLPIDKVLPCEDRENCAGIGLEKGMAINQDPTEIAQQLAELKQEHRDLDAAIARLASNPGTEDLKIRRLKKRKLKLKDTITKLQSKLIPDLDA